MAEISQDWKRNHQEKKALVWYILLLSNDKLIHLAIGVNTQSIMLSGKR